tara:strand:+ start:97 stop:396 length:300 start_codon:yes stop_codon:yes gene_type:complete
MLKFLFNIFLVILLSLNISFANENLALPCAGCHGKYGQSNDNSSIPSIAGLEIDYFVKSFYEYKNNLRDNYIMRIIAKGYTEEQVIEMSKYFNKIKKND